MLMQSYRSYFAECKKIDTKTNQERFFLSALALRVSISQHLKKGKDTSTVQKSSFDGSSVKWQEGKRDKSSC